MQSTPTNRKTQGMAMQHLEPAEVLSVLRAAKAKGPREWAMILVAYKHAMRASEVCNLRLNDVDLKNGSLVVERLKGSLRTQGSRLHGSIAAFGVFAVPSIWPSSGESWSGQ